MPFWKRGVGPWQVPPLAEPEKEDAQRHGEDTTAHGMPPPALHGVDRRVAVLVTLAGDQVGRKHVLRGEAVIGRTAEADVPLFDALVSRRHALLRPLAEGGFEVEDLGSSNGTMVNGERVRRRALDPGDRVQLGNHTLLFLHHDPVQDQVLQRQKLEAIGRLGAGIAHDFNNLLGAVLSTVEYLGSLSQDRPLSDPEIRECLGDVRHAAVRATELTRRILAFSRIGHAGHDVVDLTMLCGEVVQLLRRTFDRSIVLRQDIESGLFVKGHQGELHQVLMNLCINARDAMPIGGELHVEAALRAPEELTGVPVLSAVPHVVLTVRDTGIGMDEVTRRRVFEPFFTTKPVGAGAGLGLATVYEVVTGHGGTVTLDSAPGKGTIVRAYLPASDKTPPHARPFSTTAEQRIFDQAAAMPGLRVLVVDDEELVRRSLGRLLERAGHAVTMACDGADALEVFEADGPRPDVILLDLDMPRLDGVATLERIRAIAPYATVLCVTGLLDARREADLRRLGVNGVVEKPFAAAELLEAVASTLVTRDTPGPLRAPAQVRPPPPDSESPSKED